MRHEIYIYIYVCVCVYVCIYIYIYIYIYTSKATCRNENVARAFPGSMHVRASLGSACTLVSVPSSSISTARGAAGSLPVAAFQKEHKTQTLLIENMLSFVQFRSLLVNRVVSC
jgi:hypothetical protein